MKRRVSAEARCYHTREDRLAVTICLVGQSLPQPFRANVMYQLVAIHAHYPERF